MSILTRVNRASRKAMWLKSEKLFLITVKWKPLIPSRSSPCMGAVFYTFVTVLGPFISCVTILPLLLFLPKLAPVSFI